MSELQGTCEQLTHGVDRATCGKDAVLRYEAMGGWHMRLCAEHGAKHADYCERWDGSMWLPMPARVAKRQRYLQRRGERRAEAIDNRGNR